MSDYISRESICNDCGFVKKCKARENLPVFSRSNIVYCDMFLRKEDLFSVQGKTIEVSKWRFEDE